MDSSEIPVVKREQYATYRQVIRPESQEQVSPLLVALHRILRLNRFTGHITLHLNQGGVREIVTEQKTSQISENSTAGKALDIEFGK